jgi:catechol 2,3-dioxygenase-like lactoylglutathione lyase family enzyme
MATGHTVHYRFHHRHLIVADVAKTVAFYEDTLGAKKVQEMEFRGRPFVRLELDGLPLTISQQIHTGVGSHIGRPLMTLRPQSLICAPKAWSLSWSRQT